MEVLGYIRYFEVKDRNIEYYKQNENISRLSRLRKEDLQAILLQLINDDLNIQIDSFS
jgi:hypothetical protein